MAHLHSLSIKHFRGFSELKQVFGDEKFVCLIGRGDTGKSTILEAISYVLSPQWNISFHDSDFLNCDTSIPIEIEATLTDLPDKIMDEEKFGMYIRTIKADGVVSDDIDDDSQKVALTIRLTVEKDLEPEWAVVNGRQEPKFISAGDRSKLNTFLVSDYVDRHFSWTRGNPLYALLQKESDGDEDEDDNAIIEALRHAKTTIDGHAFSELNGVVSKITSTAKTLGLDISKTKNTIDVRDLFVSDGKISLHDGKIPFRLKGKGSKRLLSIAIQNTLIKEGGIMLIDEIEQGLEPDRVQNIVRRFKESASGQIFITTHSRDVLVELEAKNLFLVRKGGQGLIKPSADLQGVLRSNPEAFFATKVLVCEGATEIGICRAIDNFKIKRGEHGATYEGLRFADGGGETIIANCKGFFCCKYVTALFCDSDVDKKKGAIKTAKDGLRQSGIKVFDWNEGDSLEEALVKDLSLDFVKDMLALACRVKEAESTDSFDVIKNQIIQAIEAKYGKSISYPLTKENDCIEIRCAIGKAAKKGNWFKSVSKGEKLGELVLKHYPAAEASNKVKVIFNNISLFIDGTQL